jgi:hypothetical protein
MKIFFVILFLAVSASAFCQHENYYHYSCVGDPSKEPADEPHFFNADSVLKVNHFQTAPHDYKTIDARIANYDMEVLGELHGEYFVKEVDHTFIRDINILLPGNDTAVLKQREFVYKDTAEASKIFNHLNEKVVSAISVPDYRIIYKKDKAIYFISVKSYEKQIQRQIPLMVTPIYDILAKDKTTMYLLFKHDLRIKRRH